jgi:uncharacterized phiE125 gp8 family phage protein
VNLVVVQKPTSEPIDLATAKNFLRVTTNADDALIGILITAAREAVEVFTGRSIATKTYRQGLDSFPYFTDSVISQQAYPPSYYAFPRASTTLWNYSQMIKLFAPPLVTINSIKYAASDTGSIVTLDPSKYIVDSDSEPARLFPGPAGATWPSVMYVPNAVEIEFIAGYDTDPSSAKEIPGELQIAILMLASHYYENRGEVAADIPNNIKQLLWNQRVMDMQPTRG